MVGRCVNLTDLHGLMGIDHLTLLQAVVKIDLGWVVWYVVPVVGEHGRRLVRTVGGWRGR